MTLSYLTILSDVIRVLVRCLHHMFPKEFLSGGFIFFCRGRALCFLFRKPCAFVPRHAHRNTTGYTVMSNGVACYQCQTFSATS